MMWQQFYRPFNSLLRYLCEDYLYAFQLDVVLYIVLGQVTFCRAKL